MPSRGSTGTPTVSISSSSISRTPRTILWASSTPRPSTAPSRGTSARRDFWCIAATLKQAGLETHPYHVYVPSFGEWGFVLAGMHEYKPPTLLPASLRFVSVDGLPALFQFPPDMAPLPMPANQLNSQVLVRSYENDWKDISH